MGGAMSIIGTLVTAPFLFLSRHKLANIKGLQKLNSSIVLIVSALVWCGLAHLDDTKGTLLDQDGYLFINLTYITSVIFMISALLMITKN
jgi:hypothetical protein